MMNSHNTALGYRTGIGGPGIELVPTFRGMAQDTKRQELSEQYDKLYDLVIMEKMTIDGHFIVRVPGGWIFDRSESSVFVPYIDKEEQHINL